MRRTLYRCSLTTSDSSLVRRSRHRLGFPSAHRHIGRSGRRRRSDHTRAGHRSPGSARCQAAALAIRLPTRSAGVRAFSLAPISLSVPADRVWECRAAAPAFQGPAASRSPCRWMSPGWCPSPDRPRSPGTRPPAQPARSPPSSLGGIKASRPGLPLPLRRDPRPASPSRMTSRCGVYDGPGCQRRDNPGRPCRRQKRMGCVSEERGLRDSWDHSDLGPTLYPGMSVFMRGGPSIGHHRSS
jgi:hypothetical protein